MKNKALIFARVSTRDRQSNDRQVEQLREKAKQMEWEVVEIITAQESASKKSAKERDSIQRLTELVTSGKIDKVLCHEVSRIGRRPAENLTLLDLCHRHGVSILSLDMGMETLTPDGSPSLAAEIVFSVLSSLAKAETSRLSDRIKSGLAEAAKRGNFPGRPKGRETRKEFLSKHGDIIRQLKAGQSVRNTAKITKKGVSTVQRVKRAMAGPKALKQLRIE